MKNVTCLRDSRQPLQIVGFENYPLIGLHIQGRTVPVAVNIPVLLDKDVVENVVGEAVLRVRLHDGGVGKALMCSSILQLLFNAADIIVVGRFAGDNSLAAVGSNASIIGLLTNLFIGPFLPAVPLF